MIRTRFAPSPTGFLHIGGARTALFAWLFARKNHGQFILRIEDTDQERSTEASVTAILEGMSWLGLDYDEGPFYQTQRMGRYKAVIEEMLAASTAYRCYCSKERLEALRTEQMNNKEKPRYDGRCRYLDLEQQPSNESYVVRFRNPLEGEVIFEDEVYGQIRVRNSELDDLIIARSDGLPTYNFTVVIDDWDMKITHVIRGDDHINNTPRQINILKALSADIPIYAHVPMILGPDGKRLSKRQGAASVLQYHEEGYLSEALINYLVRLGWAYGDQEIFSREELINAFDLKSISRAAASVNPEKLLWLNQHYMKAMAPEKLSELTIPYFAKQGVTKKVLMADAMPSLLAVYVLQAERCKTLVELVEKSLYFYLPIQEYEEKARIKYFNADAITILENFSQQIEALIEWNKQNIHEVLTQFLKDLDLSMGAVAPLIRLAVTGSTVSPSLDVTLELLGKKQVLARLQQAIEYITKNTPIS